MKKFATVEEIKEKFGDLTYLDNGKVSYFSFEGEGVSYFPVFNSSFNLICYEVFSKEELK